MTGLLLARVGCEDGNDVRVMMLMLTRATARCGAILLVNGLLVLNMRLSIFLVICEMMELVTNLPLEEMLATSGDL